MEPSDILSDEESAALREPAGAVAHGAVPADQVQGLHADHWERILANQAPALESIADRMVSLLKITGRRFFRRPVEVLAHPPLPMRWGSYTRQLPGHASLSVVDIRPAALKGLVALDAGFVFTLTDVFFGGDGKGRRGEDMEEFTPIEQRLTRRFVEAVLADLRQAWRPIRELDFGLEKTETNPLFAAIAGSSEPVSITRFGLVLDGDEHVFDIVLPAALVEPLRNLRDSAPLKPAPGAEQQWRHRLQEDVQEAQVSLRAVLAGSEINLRDIALARPGDVICTELPASIVLYAGDQPLMEGTFGACHGRNAVRISKPANRRIVGGDHGPDRDN